MDTGSDTAPAAATCPGREEEALDARHPRARADGNPVHPTRRPPSRQTLAGASPQLSGGTTV